MSQFRVTCHPEDPTARPARPPARGDRRILLAGGLRRRSHRVRGFKFILKFAGQEAPGDEQPQSTGSRGPTVHRDHRQARQATRVYPAMAVAGSEAAARLAARDDARPRWNASDAFRNRHRRLGRF